MRSNWCLNAMNQPRIRKFEDILSRFSKNHNLKIWYESLFPIKKISVALVDPNNKNYIASIIDKKRDFPIFRALGNDKEDACKQYIEAMLGDCFIRLPNSKHSSRTFFHLPTTLEELEILIDLTLS